MPSPQRRTIHSGSTPTRREPRTVQFGTTIGHGFLTLSLCVPMLYEALPQRDGTMTVNYGTNRVRFPSPVPSGCRIRGRFRVASVEETPRGGQAVIDATVERDGETKPVCVAQLVVLAVT